MAKLKIKKCAKFTELCRSQLEEIVRNLEICSDDKCREVHFSERPPRNEGTPWQQIDEDGLNIGKIKYYTNGKWT